MAKRPRMTGMSTQPHEPNQHPRHPAMRPHPTRCDFLRFTGLGAAAMLTPRVFAGPFDNTPNADLGLDAKHPVPLDKTLTAGQTPDVTVGSF